MTQQTLGWTFGVKRGEILRLLAFTGISKYCTRSVWKIDKIPWFFFFLWAGLRDPIACSLLDGGIPYHNSGYKITRLCPFFFMLVFYFVYLSSIPVCRRSRGIHSSAPLHSAPLDPLAPLNSSPTKAEPYSKSVAYSASSDLFFAPSKSMPACSHHHRDTLTPSLRAERSQRSRIGCVALYFATVFCLLVMDFLIPVKPDSPIASSNGG